MGEIARINNVDIWWEDYGEKSNTSVLLIMGANASGLYWDRKFIDELVANDLHIVIFDNRDVGKSTWFNNEPFLVKLAKFLLMPCLKNSSLPPLKAWSTMTENLKCQTAKALNTI